MSSVWNTSAGNPAPHQLLEEQQLPGTLEACLSSPVFPATSAGARKRTTCHSGKFHGMTASTGPSGW